MAGMPDDYFVEVSKKTEETVTAKRRKLLQQKRRKLLQFRFCNIEF